MNRDCFSPRETLLRAHANECTSHPDGALGVGGDVFGRLYELRHRASKGDKGRTGRAGRGWGARPMRDSPSKGVVSHSNYKVQRVVG